MSKGRNRENPDQNSPFGRSAALPAPSTCAAESRAGSCPCVGVPREGHAPQEANVILVYHAVGSLVPRRARQRVLGTRARGRRPGRTALPGRLWLTQANGRSTDDAGPACGLAAAEGEHKQEPGPGTPGAGRAVGSSAVWSAGHRWERDLWAGMWGDKGVALQRPGERPSVEGEPHCCSSGFWHVSGAGRGQGGGG